MCIDGFRGRVYKRVLSLPLSGLFVEAGPLKELVGSVECHKHCEEQEQFNSSSVRKVPQFSLLTFIGVGETQVGSEAGVGRL